MLLQDSLWGKVPDRTHISYPRGEGNTSSPIWIHSVKGQCEMAIFLFCCQNVNFAKCEFCCLKGIQCPSRHHFSELTPQDNVFIGTACLCSPTPPAQIQKSFPLTSLQSLTKTYGNIWFCMQIFTKKKWILFHSFQYKVSSAEKLPAVHACWFGTGTAHSLESGMKPQTPFARGVNSFPRSRWEHAELVPAF